MISGHEIIIIPKFPLLFFLTTIFTLKNKPNRRIKKEIRKKVRYEPINMIPTINTLYDRVIVNIKDIIHN